MGVNILHQNPCMLSWPGVFLFGIFLSVTSLRVQVYVRILQIINFSFPSFLLCGEPGRQSPLIGRFSFLLLLSLYLKIPKNFMRLIFLDGFLVGYIPFVRMVIFKLLTQFRVDYLPHSVISGITLSLG